MWIHLNEEATQLQALKKVKEILISDRLDDATVVIIFNGMYDDKARMHKYSKEQKWRIIEHFGTMAKRGYEAEV